MADQTGGRSPFTVLHFLMGVSFPADRGRLVEHARRRNAGTDVLGVLERLPDRRYEGMADVEEVLRQMEV